MSTICIIPARGGSTRVPGKNIREFHGKPIIAYSIETAQKSGLFDRIIVSTETPIISAVAHHYGAEVWRRDPRCAANEVGTQEVVRECLLGIGAKDSDMVCCIYATAPLMWGYDLAAGHDVLAFSPGITYAFSVGDKPLADAGQFYWGRAEAFILDLPLVHVDSRMIYVDDRRVCDINTEEDWDRALQMYEDLHNG